MSTSDARRGGKQANWFEWWVCIRVMAEWSSRDDDHLLLAITTTGSRQSFAHRSQRPRPTHEQLRSPNNALSRRRLVEVLSTSSESERPSKLANHHKARICQEHFAVQHDLDVEDLVSEYTHTFQ